MIFFPLDNIFLFITNLLDKNLYYKWVGDGNGYKSLLYIIYDCSLSVNKEKCPLVTSTAPKHNNKWAGHERKSRVFFLIFY